MTIVRECPSCNKLIYYTNKRSWYNAKKRNSVCKECQKQKIKNTILKKFKKLEWIPLSRDKEREKYINKKFNKKCPTCNNIMRYSSIGSLKRSISKNSLCNSCTTYKYNKNFKNIINENHIKQMRATKAGFSSWEEYVEKYPEKKLYKNEVWRLTYKQPLELLKNYEKRGRCGVDGAYQIDHIQSIEWGYRNKISAEKIASFSNLRMLPWKENRKKSFN